MGGLRLRRTLGISARSLLAYRLRVGLVLGSAAIGVAAVLVTSGLGTAARAEVLKSMRGMGTNLLVVRPAPVQRLVARRQVRGAVTTLSMEDYLAIGALPAVAQAAPGAETVARVKGEGRATVTKVLGTAPGFPRVRRFRVRAGRFFDEEDDRLAARVAVLGARVAANLFADGSEAVGRTVRVRGVPFEVIGVLEPKGAVGGSDEDNQVLVPIRTALRRVLNVRWLGTVYVSARGSTAEGERAVRALLEERHGKRDFAVQDQTKALAMQARAGESLALLTATLSAIALVVGGTGILALMLLSVKERTAEIGLRMALGARPRDVLAQFLIEASLLALGGWAAGTVGGGAGLVAVAAATRWRVALPVDALLASGVTALAAGLVFGALPARAAARIPPIAALGSR